MSNPSLGTGKVGNTKVQSKSQSLNGPGLLFACDLDSNLTPNPGTCTTTHGKQKRMRVLHTPAGSTHNKDNMKAPQSSDSRGSSSINRFTCLLKAHTYSLLRKPHAKGAPAC